MRWFSVIGIFGMLGIDASALSGSVKDDKGAALAGAVVSLVSDATIRRMTDAKGEFSLEKPVSIAGGEISWGAGGNLARPGSITLFDIHGKMRAERPIGPYGAGTHRVDRPQLAPGLYFLRLALGPVSGDAHLVHAGNKTILLRKRASSVVDTLRVEKAGFVPVKSPIASYDQTGIAIVMTPDSNAVPTLPPTNDYSAPGPFNTAVEANVGPNGAYTIVRPDPLGKDGFRHAPIIYGYGINGEIRYAMDFLRPLASHGFVIIGCNKLTGGPGSAANNTAMTNGLNWILQQNGAAGSKYQGKLAVTRAASMGYSVGGTAAVDIGGHEAIKTVVSIHGHVSKAVLHGTLLQTTGTRDNVGLPMQQQTFANSRVPTFLGTVTNADHSYPGKDGGVQRPAILAWLRYWIYNDAGAKRYFYGDDCVMCKAPWENPQRKNWQ